MSKSLKLFSLLFLLIFSAAFAEFDVEKYRLFVSKVDPELQSFVLTNGMTCHKIESSDNPKGLPAIGSEIVLYPLKTTSEHRRANKELGEFAALDDQNWRYLIWMPQDAEEYFLTVVSCQSIRTRPAGWFTSDRYENIVELSDGSRWIAQENHMFAKGDHVVVSCEDDLLGLWHLINVDRVLYLTSSNETYYYLLSVMPFQGTTEE